MSRPAAPVKGVILGMLLEGPSHGYELMTRLQELLGPAWQLSDSAVYGLLDALERKQLVCREPVQGTESEPCSRLRGRARVMYHATPEAEAEFERWMGARIRKEPLRTELLARLSVARPAHAAALGKALTAYEQECLSMLAVAEGEELPRQSSFEEMIACMVEDGAVDHLQAEISWARRARARLAEFTEEEAKPR
jgi:DNA-binding PadR family transcriptional regulator